MNENSGRDHSHRSSAHPNPRLGFYLLGFPKPVRFEPKPYPRTIPLRFPCSPRDSIGGTPIGRAFPANTATEEPHHIQTESTKSFCLNVLCVLFCYGILFCGFLMLDGHLDCIFKVKLLLMISQSSAIHFCFFANNDLSRFQAFFS